MVVLEYENWVELIEEIKIPKWYWDAILVFTSVFYKIVYVNYVTNFSKYKGIETDPIAKIFQVKNQK